MKDQRVSPKKQTIFMSKPLPLGCGDLSLLWFRPIGPFIFIYASHIYGYWSGFVPSSLYVEWLRGGFPALC